MIYVIIGTRAQLIKMAPIIRLLEKKNYSFTLLHTGQHLESLAEICRDFTIETPWKSLYNGKEVSTIKQAFIWCFSMCLMLISNKFGHQFINRPDKNVILVHGDTLSTLFGAALGKRNKIPVAHVESGLRSFNLTNPFPEEIIRLFTFQLSDIAFCPSEWAINNLKNYSSLAKINTKGNTIADALNSISNKKTDYPIPNEAYGVISIHRFENIFFQKRFKSILDQIIQISAQYPLIFVLHPTTLKRLQKIGYLAILENNPNIELRARTGYTNFISLLSFSNFVITDGGSNQEELSILGKPTYLMRNSTERQDGLGENIILGKYSIEKLNHFMQHLDDLTYPKKRIIHSPSECILTTLKPYSSIP